MRIGVFGLGYVGTVSAGCLAEMGHTVIGVDKSDTIVTMINSGLAPIVEERIGDIVKNAVCSGRLTASRDVYTAVKQSDVIFICVGTPDTGNGSINFDYIEQVCTEIGREMANIDDYLLIVIRSTMLPGIAEEIAIPALEQSSNKKAGIDFGFCVNPEFLREGSAVSDFYNPPKTVIGAMDQRSGDILTEIFKDFPAPLFRMGINEASMVKYADNSFHALKVAFANEIGRLCKKFGVDTYNVMNVFKQDRKLNISTHYLQPGFAFGGSCLPKDLRALIYRARQSDVRLPMLEAVLESNEEHIHAALAMIRQAGEKKIGILGLSFKEGTDDLRDSPMITVIENLLGKGFDLSIYDKNVNMAKILNSNNYYLEKRFSHILKLTRATIAEVIEEANVIVIGNRAEEHKWALESMNGRHKVLDLAGLINQDNEQEVRVNYEGLCW